MHTVVHMGGYVVTMLPGLFSQLFTHLISNSVRHGFAENKHGNINVRIEIDEGNLLIEYEDNGPSERKVPVGGKMPPQDQRLRPE